MTTSTTSIATPSTSGARTSIAAALVFAKAISTRTRETNSASPSLDLRQ